MNTKHRLSDETIGLLLVSTFAVVVIIFCAIEVLKSKSIARAYYYKYTLETSEKRYMPQIEDAEVIKFLDIQNRKQLENDVKNLQENYR